MVKIDLNCCLQMSKCTKFDFGWGSAPDPAGGAHVQYSTDLLARFKGSYTSKRRGRGGGKGMGRGGDGKKGKAGERKAGERGKVETERR